MLRTANQAPMFSRLGKATTLNFKNINLLTQDDRSKLLAKKNKSQQASKISTVNKKGQQVEIRFLDNHEFLNRHRAVRPNPEKSNSKRELASKYKKDGLKLHPKQRESKTAQAKSRQIQNSRSGSKKSQIHGFKADLEFLNQHDLSDIKAMQSTFKNAGRNYKSTQRKLDEAGKWGPVVGTYFPKHEITKQRQTNDYKFGTADHNKEEAQRKKEKLSLSRTTLCDRLYTRLSNQSPLKVFKEKEEEIKKKELEFNQVQTQQKREKAMNTIALCFQLKIIKNIDEEIKELHNSSQLDLEKKIKIQIMRQLMKTVFNSNKKRMQRDLDKTEYELERLRNQVEMQKNINKESRKAILGLTSKQHDKFKCLKLKQFDARGQSYNKTSFFDTQDGMIVDIKASSLALTATQMKKLTKQKQIKLENKLKHQNPDKASKSQEHSKDRLSVSKEDEEAHAKIKAERKKMSDPLKLVQMSAKRFGKKQPNCLRVCKLSYPTYFQSDHYHITDMSKKKKQDILMLENEKLFKPDPRQRHIAGFSMSKMPSRENQVYKSIYQSDVYLNKAETMFNRSRRISINEERINSKSSALSFKNQTGRATDLFQEEHRAASQKLDCYFNSQHNAHLWQAKSVINMSRQSERPKAKSIPQACSIDFAHIGNDKNIFKKTSLSACGAANNINNSATQKVKSGLSFSNQIARDNFLYCKTQAYKNVLLDYSKEQREEIVEERKKNRWKYRHALLIPELKQSLSSRKF